jgi:membrane-bound lytic murein transglycosylase A
MTLEKTSIFNLAAIVIALLTTSCVSTTSTTTVPGRGELVSWRDLPGWETDDVREVWPALENNCATRNLPGGWTNLCAEIALLTKLNDALDNATVRAYIETRFIPRQLVNEDSREGLITGYYEPILNGSRQPDARYRYPLYGRPKDLVTVQLDELFPELAGKTVRGRLEGNKVLPFYSRAEIDSGNNSLAGLEIAWVDDAVDLFFLHIQGSGRIRLKDGSMMSVGYVDQNGHPYESIGSSLIRRGELKSEEVSLYTIKNWLANHPEQAREVLYSNPSYIFFTVRDQQLPGPIGSLGIPLTAERSMAIDRKFIELGSLVWLDTNLPGEHGSYQRLMVAQDTGGAINGVVRADIFFGRGDRARELAGTMKHPGKLYVLEVVPRDGLDSSQ